MTNKLSRVRRALIALTLPLLAAAPSFAQDTLRIGLIPAEDSQAMIESSRKILDQLQEQIGMPVKPFVATDYNGVIEALRSKKLDVAYLGPFSYVLANQVAGVEAFAVAVTKKTGQSAYKSVIISRKGSGIAGPADLKGRNFAFVDPTSASGHLFPKAGLLQAGYNPEAFFGRIIFSGSHDASILAVANNKVDAAAVADRILASAIAKGQVKQEDLQIVWSSSPIPESPMVWRKDLDPALKAKIVKALANIKDLPWGDQGVLNGFQPTNDAAYNVVRDTAKVLKLDLGKNEVIRVRSLTKSYGDNAVLRGVDLDAAPGEFVVILGESGAGKSTLLRCMNRLVVADGGELRIDGMDAIHCADARALRRQVAMIFQHHHVVPRLTALKNVLTGCLGSVSTLASIFHLFPQQDIELAHKCLDRVGLAHKAGARTDSLSGGQIQRVGIARALAQRPKVILADEPVASLDPQAARKVLQYLRDASRELGITVLCNLHQVDYATEFADRIVGLARGRVVFDGLPQALGPEDIDRIYQPLAGPGMAVMPPAIWATPQVISNAACS